MSTVVTENLKRAAEAVARSLRGVVASWLNINGTGTVVIRDSQNISSITDNGTGDYTQNFTASMLNSNYSPAGWTSYTGAATAGLVTADGTVTPTSSALRFRTGNATTGVTTDFNRPCIAVHGDLA
jgi:hypothetical protein